MLGPGNLNKLSTAGQWMRRPRRRQTAQFRVGDPKGGMDLQALQFRIASAVGWRRKAFDLGPISYSIVPALAGGTVVTSGYRVVPFCSHVPWRLPRRWAEIVFIR